MMNIKRYPLLHCFNCGRNSRGKFGLIVTDSDGDVSCKKVSAFIERMWAESEFHMSTTTAQSFVNSFAGKQLLNHKDCSKTFFSKIVVKDGQSELSNALQHSIEAIQKGVLNVSDILIASNKSFSIPQLFEYLQVMYACQKALISKNVLVSGVFGHSYTCLLPSGHSELEVCSGHEGDYCGLLPMGDSVTLSTTGLVWNLNNQKLQFDLLISSSNQLDGSEKVCIKSDGTVMWTMGVNCDNCEQT